MEQRDRGADPPGLATAWCGVGGERGGEVVPRWFGVLPELGVEHVHLFWAVPGAGELEALDALRSVSSRWLAELEALGMRAELAIKRGEPGPWLSSLAGLSGSALVVLGPPAERGGSSATLDHLLEEGEEPLLVLPDLARLPAAYLLERPVVDAPSPSDAGRLAREWGWSPAEAQPVDLSSLDPGRASRAAVRVAEDLDATLLVLPRRGGLVRRVLELAAVPVLVVGPQREG